jgi:hypothetical protein
MTTSLYAYLYVFRLWSAGGLRFTQLITASAFGVAVYLGSF